MREISRLTLIPALTADERAAVQCLYIPGYDGQRGRVTGLVEGTGKWLLRHPQYGSWRENRQPSLMWISGDPRCGKSHLASLLVDELSRSASSHLGPKDTVCYFFFRDDDETLSSATSAARTLLHQLFTAKPSLIKHAMADFQSKGAKLASDFNSLWGIFMDSIADPKCGPVFCVVDGLDECNESSRLPLMKALASFYSRSNNQSKESLKTIVTSRPYNSIVGSLPPMRLELEKETTAIANDVEIFVKLRMEEICSRKDISVTLSDRLQEQLLENANKTFLWVSQILRMIDESDSVSKSSLDEIINTLPRDLDAIYERTLEKSTDPAKAKRILHIVAAASRPLSLQELNIAFCITSTDRSYHGLDLEPNIGTTARSLCGLFVRVIDSTVYLIHQTAKEFLVNAVGSDNGALWKHSLRKEESALVLAERCMWYLSLSDFEDNPLEYRHGIDQIADANDPNRYDHIHRYMERFDFLSYATSSWGTHFREAKIQEDSALMQLSCDLCDTMTGRFQTWFQVYWYLNHKTTRYPTYYTDLLVRYLLGHDLAVGLLLDRGADVSARIGDTNLPTTALNVASISGHDAVVKLLNKVQTSL